MPSPFDAVALEFVTFAIECAGSDAAAKVTVESVNPDTGAVLATAANVYAIKRARRRLPVTVGGQGGVPADLCRFDILAVGLAFALKHPDRVTSSDGTVWVVDERGVEHIAFGQLYIAQVSRKRA
jgi:hypothetical protein